MTNGIENGTQPPEPPSPDPRVMSVITDQNETVVDIASERENLSRGYRFVNFREYIDLPETDVQIGDSFDGKTVTQNSNKRTQARKKGIKRRICNLKAEKQAADMEGYTEESAEIQKQIESLKGLLGS